MLENGLEECSCKRKHCQRHGKCSECIAYHQEYKYPMPPYCKQKVNKKSIKTNYKRMSSAD